MSLFLPNGTTESSQPPSGAESTALGPVAQTNSKQTYTLLCVCVIKLCHTQSQILKKEEKNHSLWTTESQSQRELLDCLLMLRLCFIVVCEIKLFPQLWSHETGCLLAPDLPWSSVQSWSSKTDQQSRVHPEHTVVSTWRTGGSDQTRTRPELDPHCKPIDFKSRFIAHVELISSSNVQKNRKQISY